MRSNNTIRKTKRIWELLIISLIMPIMLTAQDVAKVERELMEKADRNIEQYRKGDASIRFIDKEGNPMSNLVVAIEQQSHDFLFGCIIFDLIWEEDVYRPELFKGRFKKIFNLAVFPFYWPAYESHQGREGWEKMLPVLEWCQLNGITTKGHPLVWPCETGTPDWLKNYSPETITDLSQSRVMNIVAGFRDQIGLWDVVNEPVNLKTWDSKVSDLDDANDWGHKEPIPDVADYVEDALEWANTANPEATLMINEYQTIVNEDVRTRYDALITELKRRNAPLKGIGIQAHEPRQEWFAPAEVWETFDLYAKHDLPIHITELHPQSSGVPITGDWRTGPWTPEAQQEFTEQFVRLCFGHPSVASINWWGFSDRNIWLPGGGVVDETYGPKPVYHMLDTLINHTWHTGLEVRTDQEGNALFRGFYGKYKVSINAPDGGIRVYRLHLRNEEENDWVFIVE